jgi:hypothetical protein
LRTTQQANGTGENRLDFSRALWGGWAGWQPGFRRLNHCGSGPGAWRRAPSGRQTATVGEPNSPSFSRSCTVTSCYRSTTRRTSPSANTAWILQRQCRFWARRLGATGLGFFARPRRPAGASADLAKRRHRMPPLRGLDPSRFGPWTVRPAIHGTGNLPCIYKYLSKTQQGMEGKGGGVQRGTIRTEGGGSPPSPPEEPAGLFRAPALGRGTRGPLYWFHLCKTLL